MQLERLRSRRLELEHTSDLDASRIRMMAVGELAEWLLTHGGLPASREVAYASFADVTLENLEKWEPEIIVSPVLSRSFDCIDLAQRLADIGFEGGYRAIGLNLPRPKMIEREIRELCPRLDFKILSTD